MWQKEAIIISIIVIEEQQKAGVKAENKKCEAQKMDKTTLGFFFSAHKNVNWSFFRNFKT